MNISFHQNLCIKDLTKNISVSEKKLLTDWLDKSNQNKLEYENIKNTWNSTSPNKLEYEVNIEEEWSSLQNRIIAETINIKKTGSSISKILSSLFAPKLRPAWAIGTVLLLIISTTIFWNYYEPTLDIKTIATVNNQRLEVQLSDGSFVQLNSDSEIQYFENFESDKREIRLKGEAFFSVNKDGRPFIISTDNAVTTVLGTKFNVWSRDNETRVLVREGNVSLSDNINSINKVFLTKDQLSKVKETLPPEAPTNVDADYILGWLNGKLVFNNTPLDEIAEELERFYDRKVTLKNEELAQFSLTGSFDNQKIDSVLAKICLALDLSFVVNNDKFEIQNNLTTN
jgi:transmembrane sensor